MSLFRRLGMANFGKAAGGEEIQTIIVGVFNVSSPISVNYVGYNDNTKPGSIAASSWGSISDGTWNLYDGTGIYVLTHTTISGTPTSLTLTVGGDQPNDSRWSTMSITNGATVTNFTRASASYSQDAGLAWSRWAWSPGIANPFGSNGATNTVIWT